MADESRFIPNTFPQLFTLSHVGSHMTSALEEIVANCPPQSVYPSNVLEGVWAGPTGLAYLFLHVSLHHPGLRIADKPAAHWAQEYIRGSSRGQLSLGTRSCGLINEKMSYDAVRASITKDLMHVKEAVSNVAQILEGGYDNEMLYGRAGTLYLLRVIRHWVPHSAPLVERSIVMISKRLMEDGPDWSWRGERYLGPVHGDIGLVTQLVVTTPPLAPKLVEKLEQLLDKQLPSGNWPVITDGRRGGVELVQFCHGAPGMVLSLLSLRPYFPTLEAKIDGAIEKGRECIWREGLLRKEPSLCHGILSNGLAIAQGQQRDHFLALATPEKMAELKADDPALFKPADYGHAYSTVSSYVPSAAWTWMVCDREEPRILLYNDV